MHSLYSKIITISSYYVCLSTKHWQQQLLHVINKYEHTQNVFYWEITIISSPIPIHHISVQTCNIETWLSQKVFLYLLLYTSVVAVQVSKLELVNVLLPVYCGSSQISKTIILSCFWNLLEVAGVLYCPLCNFHLDGTWQHFEI